MQNAITPQVEPTSTLDLPLGSRADKYETLAQEQQQRKVQEIQTVVAQREVALHQQSADAARKHAIIAHVRRLEAERNKTTWVRYGLVVGTAIVAAILIKRAPPRVKTAPPPLAPDRSREMRSENDEIDNLPRPRRRISRLLRKLERLA